MSRLIAKSPRVLALALALAVSQPAPAGEPAPAPKVAPLVWTLVSAASQQAFPAFVNWLVTPSGSSQPGAVPGPAIAPSATPSLPAPGTGGLGAAVVGMVGQAAGQAIAGRLAPVANPVIVGQPDIPLRVGADAKPNYQGVHLALVTMDGEGGAARFRSLKDGFQTGERFRLRLVSTFDAAVVIDTVNPGGTRSRLYPAADGEVISLKAGQAVLLPLAGDQFFEFANQTGNEQLLVTARDLRGLNPKDAVDGAPSNQPIYRQDEAWGTNLMQLTPPGTYAGFTQSVALQHVAAKP